MDSGHKSKPRYFGPMVVICHTPSGLYRLAELDSTVSELQFTAFCLVPYHVHSHTSISVTHLVEHDTLVKIYLEEDEEGAKEDHGGEGGAEEDHRGDEGGVGGEGSEKE
jgi:hypothetical protein